MLSLIVAIPTIAIFSMLCTSPAWIAGLIRGQRELPRLGASWLTRTGFRVWFLWFLGSAAGLVLAGVAFELGQVSVSAYFWTLAALPFFAVAQFLAFRIGYLVGDGSLRRRTWRRAQRNANAHGAWRAAQHPMPQSAEQGGLPVQQGQLPQ